LQPVAGGDATALSLGVLTLDELEQRHIVETLQRVRWHQGQAAELLGISAKTLYRKIRTFGLQRPGSVS
jgi:two-component system NtrC family response regulator